LDIILNEYSDHLKLKGNASPIESFEMYSSMSRDQLDKLDAETCYEISMELLQYSIFLQREINREQSRINWCDAYISNVVSKHWNNYDKYMPKDIKVAAISEEYPNLKKALSIKSKAECLIKSVEHLPNLIKNYSDLFSNYGKVKSWKT